ncbi:MAG TPA: hypothetical protein VFJ77_12000 [Gaiellaceae bacterium]|nr:hypothetical protein [Gaiellaceae bacterium]
MTEVQVVAISALATSFTAVCEACAREEDGWEGASFAGRLDLDLVSAMFLCRRGHRLRVERVDGSSSAATEAA